MKHANWSAGLLSPSLDDIAEIGAAVLAGLPGAFLENIPDIVIQVLDFPDEDMCQELDVESPYEILGLYSGAGLAGQSVLDQPEDIDMIFLFRRPILDCWSEGEDTLAAIVTHVLVHEIGHHLGLSDEAMEILEDNSLAQKGSLN